MINKKTVHVIIPARGGSQRLKKKNLYPIAGRPMIYWSIKACTTSKYIDTITVTTEDKDIKDYVNTLDVDNLYVIDRPLELADNKTFKQEAICHAVMNTKLHDIIISLQPNSPEVRTKDLDAALDKFILHDRNELISVDNNLIQNAAFRIMKDEYVFQKTLSTKSGAFITDYIDIHDEDDVKLVERSGRLEGCIQQKTESV